MRVESFFADQLVSSGRTGYAMNGLMAEVLPGTQAIGNGIKTTLGRVDNRDWRETVSHVVYLYNLDKKKQIKVILLWGYFLKDRHRTDAIRGSIPNIKRTREGVIVIRDSPARKKGKSDPSATITQFAQAKATTATQLGQLATQTRQI
jgi:hypothetical protein